MGHLKDFCRISGKIFRRFYVTERPRGWTHDHYFPTIYYVFCLAFTCKERESKDGKTLNFEFRLFSDCIWMRLVLQPKEALDCFCLGASFFRPGELEP